MTDDDSVEVTEDKNTIANPRRYITLIRLIKWIIAVVVIVGLFLAARAAIEQWQSESAKLQQNIRQIEQDLGDNLTGTEHDALTKEVRRLQASVPRLGNLRWDLIGIASVLYGIGLVPPGILLRRALLSLGEAPRISTAIAAQLLGHAGKYVPGKAMVVVLRAGALARDNVRPFPAMVSVFMETLLMMAVGAAVAGIVICWLPVPKWMIVTSLAVAVVASLPTLPPILKRVAARVAQADALEQTGGVQLFVIGWICSLVSWLLIGASFMLLIVAIPSASPLPDGETLFAIATAAISLAMVVGFASLLPGGAGVRELVLTTILASSLGTSHALLAAIAARLMFIVVETIMASASWLWLRGRKR